MIFIAINDTQCRIEIRSQRKTIFLGLLVNQRLLKFKNFFRTAYYFPSITSSVAISLIFLFLYQKSGLVNNILGTLTFGNWEPLAWMADPRGVFHILLENLGITLREGPEFLRTEVLGFEATDGIAVLTLLEVPVQAIAEGDTFTIRAGCDKRMETCGAKFANTANFRGFPHIPGQDAVLRYATRDGGHEGAVL